MLAFISLEGYELFHQSVHKWSTVQCLCQLLFRRQDRGKTVCYILCYNQHSCSPECMVTNGSSFALAGLSLGACSTLDATFSRCGGALST